MKNAGRIAILASLFLFTGCVAVYPQSYSLPAPLKPNQCGGNIFSYPKTRIFATITPDWSPNKEKISKYIISFPLLNENGTMEAEYYKQEFPGKKKLIIVLPIIDSTAFVGKHYAHVMTSWDGNTDFNVLLVKDTKKIFPFDQMQQSLTDAEFLEYISISAINIKNYIINMRRLIDWAQDLEDIDSTRIGIIGGSIAASFASLVMASDNRIIAGVFDKGGGNLHEIFGKSEESKIKETREIVLKKFGWNREKLENLIEPILSNVNPTLWARNINPSRVLFISAKNDSWMGLSSVESLWQALGQPKRIDYLTSHKFAFLLSLTIFGGHYADLKIFNHFKNKLQ